MAQKKRLSPNQKAELKANLAGLKTIADYKSSKVEFSIAEVEKTDAALDNLDTEISQAKTHLADLLIQGSDKSALFTSQMKGVRQQVIAQFGDDSPEYEAVGGIRSSARRTGLHRGKAGNNVKPNG